MRDLQPFIQELQRPVRKHIRRVPLLVRMQFVLWFCGWFDHQLVVVINGTTLQDFEIAVDMNVDPVEMIEAAISWPLALQARRTAKPEN